MVYAMGRIIVHHIGEIQPNAIYVYNSNHDRQVIIKHLHKFYAPQFVLETLCKETLT